MTGWPADAGLLIILFALATLSIPLVIALACQAYILRREHKRVAPSARTRAPKPRLSLFIKLQLILLAALIGFAALSIMELVELPGYTAHLLLVFSAVIIMSSILTINAIRSNYVLHNKPMRVFFYAWQLMFWLLGITAAIALIAFLSDEGFAVVYGLKTLLWVALSGVFGAWGVGVVSGIWWAITHENKTKFRYLFLLLLLIPILLLSLFVF